MKRGPLIHGVLLVAALLFAYQSWTREEKVVPKTGTIKVWSLSVDSITAVAYDTPQKTTGIEKRTEGNETYWWGKETRTMTKKVKKPELPPNPDGTVPEVLEETKTIHDQFAVGKRADNLVKQLADLRALRSLPDLSEDKRAEYGLDKSDNNITVTHAGGSKTLVIGAKVFGTRDRFVIDVDSNKAYAVSGEVVGDLLQGQSGLTIRKYHAYEEDTVATATVKAGEATHELKRITVEAEGKTGRKAKTWARAESPEKADQTMANFLDRVRGMRGLSYEVDAKEEGMKVVFRIDYKNDAGQALGWFEMWEKPPAEPEPAPATPAGEGADPAAGAADAGANKDAADKDAAGKDAAGKDAAGKDAAADGKAEGDKGEPTKADEKKPAEKKKSAYYLRTERTRLFMLLSHEQATRVVQDVESILAGK